VTSDLMALALALAAGGALGVFYFGGLWFTIQRLPGAERPGLIALISFMLRTAIAIGALVLVAGESWQRLLAAMVGFFVARMVLVRRLGRIDKQHGEVDGKETAWN